MNARIFRRLNWLPAFLGLLLGAARLARADTAETEGTEKREWFRRRLSQTVEGSPWRLAPLGALKGAAASGSAEARLALALRLEKGDGIAADFRRAEALVREAAESGHAASQFLLGQVEAEDAFSPGGISVGNYRVAEEWWEKAAAQGHIRAMVELGGLHRYGQLGWDHKKAAAWYLKAAKLGDVGAMREYGEIFMDDRVDLDHDHVLAEAWLRKAADRDDDRAMLSLGELLVGLPGRMAEAHTWFRRAADAGQRQAASLVEFIDLAGDAKAVREAWLALPENGSGPLGQFAAAIHGSDPSNSQLARIREEVVRLLRGLDSTPLLLALVRLHREAAPANLAALRTPYLALPESDVAVTDAGLCLELAELYWNGSRSVPADRQRAVAWFLRSAQRGDVRAMRRIAALWRDGSGGSPDPGEADRWEARAAAVGVRAK